MRSPIRHTPAEVILTGCQLIDGINDQPLANAYVEIRNGKIVSSGPMAKAPQDKGLHEIDCQGRTVMPGLIDAHVHLTGTPDSQFWQEAVTTDEYSVAVGLANAATTLRAGFTTVRDLGSPKLAGFAVRDAIANGLEIGPRR